MESSSVNDESVFLICVNPKSIETSFANKLILISTTDIQSWNLITILGYQKIKVLANRSRLVEESSYFRGLLSGSFRESDLECISIQWNSEAFLNALKFIYGCSLDISFVNIIPLFEAALFFGVETLIAKCESWFSEIISVKSISAPQMKLDDLIDVWNFGLEHANRLIQEMCACCLARNFMWAMSCESFCGVSYSLLVSCIKHPDLTIDSEKHLCDTLLVWLKTNPERLKGLSAIDQDLTNLLKQIRVSLLPLWYAVGKRKCRYFSRLADDGIEVILDLVKLTPMGLIKKTEDHDSKGIRIRLTEYTKKVDLSGCPQVTLELLLLSVCPSSYVMDGTWKKHTKYYLTNLQHLEKHQTSFANDFPTMSFEAVEEVDISKCSRLNLAAAISCFSKSFPSLRILKATHLPNFDAIVLVHAAQRCPLVSEINLTVDVTPIVPSQVTVLSSSVDVIHRRLPNFFSRTDDLLATNIPLRGPLMWYVTKLTLEGRSDVTDINLKDISELCLYLYYLNLRGCISVTDVGISKLITKCVRLHSLLFCDTNFGRYSAQTLYQLLPNCVDAHTESQCMESLAHQLQILHIGGCKAVDEASLLELISQTHKLKSLCLRDSNLVDIALSSCPSSSLEMIDISSTKVSISTLALIVSRSPGLKCLKARDCRKLYQSDTNIELFIQLGNTCQLEEISLGWGFNAFALEALKPAMASVKAITVGLGGSLGQDSLALLPTLCPLLETLILYFQVISDSVMITILKSLKQLKELGLCYCLGGISPLSFHSGMPNLSKLKLQRVTPWMTNQDLVSLAQNCKQLIELSLLGCTLLDSESQQIISQGWPGLISIHLEECGGITALGIDSLLDCIALEDLVVRHNGPGIQSNFIMDAASRMPMLRKLSLDMCDARSGEFDLPNYFDRNSLRMVTLAECEPQKCSLDLQIKKASTRQVHKETKVLAWDSRSLTTTVVRERL